MATVTTAYKNLGASLKALATHAGNAFERLGMALGGTASGSLSFAGKTGGLLVAMAKQPVKWVAYGAQVPVKMLSGSFKHMPILTAGVTVLGTGVVVGRWVHNRAERRTQNEMMDQAAQIQAQMAAVQQPTYKLAPGEFDALAAPKMRDSSNGTPVSHAERILAAKQAAAPTDSANLAAL